MADSFDARAARREFPVLEREIQGRRVVYLDSACTALKSSRVAERQREFYEDWGGCGGSRSSHRLSQEIESRVDEARRSIARFINAETPNEVVFTSGTTESVNLVAYGFPYGERREVIVTDLEHNSVLLPFHEASRRLGIKLRLCPTRDGQPDLDALEDMLGEKTALVAMTRSSNVYGGALPAAEACRLAHKAGAKVLVDDAQYLSSHREDVRAHGADFAVFSAHKLGGPFGTGVLYGKEHLLNGLSPWKVGGGTVKDVAWSRGGPKVDYLDAPRRLEAGVPNYAGILGLAEAAAWLQSLPPDGLRAHAASLVDRLAGRLEKVPEIRVLGRRENLRQGSLVSFHPIHPGFSPTDLNIFLNNELPGRFVAVRVGEHCAHLAHQKLSPRATVRASFFAYTIAEEVDVFADAVEAYARAACARRTARRRAAA